ncbi:uncharacterized protein LOC110834383 isoform X2 [Zootermopsis nevadensis]|uniref:uncharacterized protein LOC110834383 isoform X2 n=1 Tax=Zootermopsis nevadensis TaxID=136037 RepID=UPI000B8EBFA7|nr:uncharacterized protein LOC110834383 isoform X2 [Zootermopsis nevadensis]
MVRGRKKNNCSPLKLRLVRVFSNGGTTSSSQPSSPTVPQRHSFHSTSLESLRFPSRPQSDGNLSLEPCLVRRFLVFDLTVDHEPSLVLLLLVCYVTPAADSASSKEMLLAHS